MSITVSLYVCVCVVIPAWASWSCWLSCVSCCFLHCYWTRCQPSSASFSSSLSVWLLLLSGDKEKGVMHRCTTPKHTLITHCIEEMYGNSICHLYPTVYFHTLITFRVVLFVPYAVTQIQRVVKCTAWSFPRLCLEKLLACTNGLMFFKCS